MSTSFETIKELTAEKLTEINPSKNISRALLDTVRRINDKTTEVMTEDGVLIVNREQLCNRDPIVLLLPEDCDETVDSSRTLQRAYPGVGFLRKCILRSRLRMAAPDSFSNDISTPQGLVLSDNIRDIRGAISTPRFLALRQSADVHEISKTLAHELLHWNDHMETVQRPTLTKQLMLLGRWGTYLEKRAYELSHMLDIQDGTLSEDYLDNLISQVGEEETSHMVEVNSGALAVFLSNKYGNSTSIPTDLETTMYKTSGLTRI